MLSINDQFPDFEIQSVTNGNISTITSDDLKGTWSIIFFYPEDYSFICPTEVSGFENHREYLEENETKLIGISVDDIQTHQKWAKELDIHYPLASDTSGELAKRVGVLDTSDNRTHRATFILDPELTIQFALITSRNVGRSVKETIRVYRAIQSGKKCPADYRAGME